VETGVLAEHAANARQGGTITMHKIISWLLMGCLLSAHVAMAAQLPSRAAQKGCAWEKLSDAALGLDAWVEQCDFSYRKIHIYAKGNALMQHFSDGGEDEKLIETFELKKNETPQDGIRRVFVEHTPDKTLAARCLVKPYQDPDPHASPAPAGVKRYTILPDAALKKELDAKNDPGDIPDPPCGDWGDAPDSIQYYETQAGARRVMFVRAGQDEPPIDEKTQRLLPLVH
jgi:hypothetical protein